MQVKISPEMLVDIDASLSLFPLDKTAATSGWLDNACSTSLSEMTASFAVKPSRLTIFSSCLTFPGQVYVCINFIADGSKFLDMPVSLSTFSRKKLANNGISSNRSLSGGTVIGLLPNDKRDHA